MKRIFSLVLSAVFALTVPAVSAYAEDGAGSVSGGGDYESFASPYVLAFPGADGAGRYVTGGRGGEVYHVTNLNDSGTGSFRDAVSKPNRIIVFDVAGTIKLTSGAIIVQDNTTVAGQTAPGGAGITVCGDKMAIGGKNVIVRYVSSFPGLDADNTNGGTNTNSGEYDAWGGSSKGAFIVDHCAMGMASDEQWGLWDGVNSVTIQYSLIGPADHLTYHRKGIHGYGVMFSGNYMTMHHNLIAHNLSRNARWGAAIRKDAVDENGNKIKDSNGNQLYTFTSLRNELVNNVIYDWGNQTSYGIAGQSNLFNNYYKAGNSTYYGKWFFDTSDTWYDPDYDHTDRDVEKAATLKDNVTGEPAPKLVEDQMLYLQGNKMVENDGSVIYSDKDNNWTGTYTDKDDNTYNSIRWDKGGRRYNKDESNTRSLTPFPILDTKGLDANMAERADSADEAFNNVVSYAGSAVSAEARVNNPIVNEVLNDAKNGTGTLIGSLSLDEFKAAAARRIETKMQSLANPNATVSPGNIPEGMDSNTATLVKSAGYNRDENGVVTWAGGNLQKLLITDDATGKYSYQTESTELPPTDSDRDGMPDEWETARGLNPNDPSDANGDYLRRGYNNIEYYINDLTVNSFPDGVVALSPELDEISSIELAEIEDMNRVEIQCKEGGAAVPEDIVLPSETENGYKLDWFSFSDNVTIENNRVTAVKLGYEKSEAELCAVMSVDAGVNKAVKISGEFLGVFNADVQVPVSEDIMIVGAAYDSAGKLVKCCVKKVPSNAEVAENVFEEISADFSEDGITRPEGGSIKVFMWGARSHSPLESLVSLEMIKIFKVEIAAEGMPQITYPISENFMLADKNGGRFVLASDATAAQALENTKDVQGNLTPKLELNNKAVQLPLEDNEAITSGKFTLSYDFLSTLGGKSGRNYRVYLDNAIHEYDRNTGKASVNGTGAAFFHMMDVGNKLYVTTAVSDLGATGAKGTLIGNTAVEANKWYRVVISGDLDNNTVDVKYYLHGTYGQYNPENISETASISGTAGFTSGRKASINQIKFMRTAGSTCYFDNIKLIAE